MSRKPLRLIAALFAAALLIGPSATTARPLPAQPATGDDAASVLHEARLRKLHLVRPDLINYPLMFDVIC